MKRGKMEQSASVFPITMIEDPFAHPYKDPKGSDAAVVGIPAACVPEGMKLVSVRHLFEDHRRRPATRQGTVNIHDVASFITFVNRYKSAKQTVIFVHERRWKRTVTAIFDYHPESGVITDTGAGKFRAVLEACTSEHVADISRCVGLPIFCGEAP